MHRPPARFDLPSIASSAAAEAATRRRMRSMESAYPAIIEWHVQAGHEAPHAGTGCVSAQVAARIAGGDFLRGAASANEALAALRLAFDALERELDAERADARARAAQWLMAVRGGLAAHV